MATTENSSQPPHDRSDRAGRRRPFSTWVKKLTSFKGSSSSNGESGTRNGSESKRSHMKSAHKKRASKKNNPYPQSGRIGDHDNSNAADADPSSRSFSTAQSGSATSLEQAGRSEDGNAPHRAGARSLAPTIATDHEGHHSTEASHGASSVAGTSRTVGGIDSRRGGDSTFSSPAPSVRSLTTTLTTIQSSVAPGQQAATNSNSNTTGATHNQTSNHGQVHSIHFNQPFPTNSPASAIPAHLAPSSGGPGHPTTYNSATANNLLTDNASILTLASSSKRRRRRSLDTDASVRAMAPSSIWGGSRESLPLSVLSANVDHQAGTPGNPGNLHLPNNPRGVASASAERTSIYSTTGVAPALPGERTSMIAKRDTGDGASTRSGRPGHGRSDSVSGSIGGVSSPLVSPRDVPAEKTGDKTGFEERVEDSRTEKEQDKENRGD